MYHSVTSGMFLENTKLIETTGVVKKATGVCVSVCLFVCVCVCVCVYLIGTDALASDLELTLGHANLVLPAYSKDTISPECKDKKLPCKSIDAAIGKKGDSERERGGGGEREREREWLCRRRQLFFFSDCKDKALP